MAPSFAPMTAWLSWLMRSALSCASARVVIVRRTVSYGVVLASAMAFATSRTDLIVAALVEQMQERREGGVAVLLISSFYHAVAGVARVVPAFEHASDSHDERGDGIMGVFFAGVVWESKFVDRCRPVVPCGGTHCEAGVCHVGLLDCCAGKIAKL